MNVKIGKEQVVVRGPKPEDSRWGFYQFPLLYNPEDGSIGASVHVGDDTWSEIGDDNKRWFISRDFGDTWQSGSPEIRKSFGLKLPNGDRLFAVERLGIDLKGIDAPFRIGNATIPGDKLEKAENGLPYPVGQIIDVWGTRYRSYLYETLPDGFVEKKWEFLRIKSGETEAATEMADLNWPNMGISASFWGNDMGTMLPPRPYGKMKAAPDGVLWVSTYMLGGLNPKNGAYSPFGMVYVLNSHDNGHTWNLKSFIKYTPDNEEYENAFTCGGYCEPDMEFMPDGSMIMLIRTAAVQYGDKEWAPSYITRSTDNGLTWSKPVRFDDIGVLPKLCRLNCGVTLAIYSRPGIYIRATEDPAGLKWDKPIEMMTPDNRSGLMNTPIQRPNFHQWAGSCCNTDIIPLSENSAMIIYSDFYYPDEHGIRRKTILTRVVSVG